VVAKASENESPLPLVVAMMGREVVVGSEVVMGSEAVVSAAVEGVASFATNSVIFSETLGGWL
jgi:hypothetical protein